MVQKVGIGDKKSVIYLGISDNHLFCGQWTKNNEKYLLSNISYKPLQKSLKDPDRTVNEIVSDINGTLQLIRENISFEGQKVYVTVPDSYCNTSLVSLDKDMTDNDGWEFAKWTIDQRWPTTETVEYFGRSFSEKSNKVFAIRVPTSFRDPLKLAIQEIGAETIWMGTESSVFFGLNPNIGNTVFNVDKNGYNYYSYTKNIFQNGFARFYKNEWKIEPFNGSSSPKDAFKGMLLSAGKLSYRRKQHFNDLRIKQLEALSGVDVEADIIPKNINESNLYVLTALVQGTVNGVAINFFDQPGLQEYNYGKEMDSVEPSKNKSENNLSSSKVRTQKKERKFLQFFLYIFFFSAIGTVLIFNNKPEVFDNLLLSSKEKTNQLLNNFSNSILSYFDPPVDESLEETYDESTLSDVIVDNNQKILYPDYLIRSQSLISSVLNTFNLTQNYDLLLLSISSGTLNLEFLGIKTNSVSVDSLGDILNYSLRQVSGQDQYKHGFLINYPNINIENRTYSNLTIDGLESFVNNLDDSTIKTLNSTQYGIDRKTPVIVRVLGGDNIKLMLEYLSTYGSNSSLDKFVYKKLNKGTEESAIYYIAVHNQTDFSTKN